MKSNTVGRKKGTETLSIELAEQKQTEPILEGRPIHDRKNQLI